MAKKKPAILCVLLLVACGKQQLPVVVHAADEVPRQLSAWGVVLADGNFFELNDRVLPYDLNTPLFSDYALKMRTLWLPAGETVTYSADSELDFPVGTIVSKTFYYEKAEGWAQSSFRVVRADREPELDSSGRLGLNKYVLIETRLLVRYEDGWQAFPYVWNAEQNEAWLEIAGDVRSMTLVADSEAQDFIYIVPDTNQCSGCHAPNHTDKKIRPIGLKARHLNRPYGYAGQELNQIEQWQTLGVLTGVEDNVPESVRWTDPGDATLDERARAYLDINCGHCHNSVGAADTSGLHLDIKAAVNRNFGICKSPTAVGRGSGDRPYDIYPGKPDDSILLYRMEHTDPAIAMPELGRSTVHSEGVALISEWIASLEGDC